MFVSVTSHAHRKLSQLKRYVSAAEFVQQAPVLMEQFRNGNSTLVGVYQNDGDPATNDILFTTDGLNALFDGERRHITYSEINKVVRDKTKENESDKIVLELYTFNHATFLVHGKDTERGTHDKHSIMMFIESAIGAVSAEST